LTANAPETKDNDFTWEEFQARNNNELVAIYGNFINRVVVLTHKYYEGVVPSAGVLSKEDETVLDEMQLLPKKIDQSITQYRFREASQLLIQLARLGNKYLAEAEPWKQIKTDPERVASIMYTALQIATGLALLSEPFLPFTAKKLAHLLHLDSLQLKWEDVGEKKELIPTDHRIEKAQLLFQKIEDVQMEQQRVKLAASAEQNQTETQTIAPLKPQTSFEDFDSLKLQVAEILEAKKVPKTKKLMELKVQLGSEIRTVISGIAQDFDEAELIGKKVTLLSNLAPRTLKGIESKGMILLGENEQGQFVFVNPEDDTVQNGAEIL